MAKFLASRLIGTFVTNGGSSIEFGITGFQISGGERTMIDITTGANSSRAKFPGLAEPLTATVNFIYQGEITNLDAELKVCGGGTLEIRTATDDDGCDVAYILGDETDGPLSVFLSSYSIEGEMDGAVTGTASFMRDENATYGSLGGGGTP